MTNDEEALKVVLARLRSGASRVDAQMELLAGGFSRDDAFRLVATAAKEVQTERTRERNTYGNLKMLAGATLFLIGLGAILYTSIAAPSIIILLPMGILAIGGYLFFAGMSRI